MARRSHLFTSAAGVAHEWEDDGQGGGLIHSSQDIAPVLEFAKAAQNHNDGFTGSRELKRVAIIPPVLQLKWLIEDGVDIWKPENSEWLMKKLNDPDYAYLRTAEGRLGKINGGGSFR